jgi:L-alanine-DL-glutamate epimerase-like enolase superfamily enzyme
MSPTNDPPIFVGTMLKLSYAPYRLLFRTPFGTAHGMRDGTDAVFVRLQQDGVYGYGEATMPPYVDEDPERVVRMLHDPDLALALRSGTEALSTYLERPSSVAAPAFRAALVASFKDLNNKLLSMSSSSEFKGSGNAVPMVTLGHGEASGYAERVAALPSGFPALKIKLGTAADRKILAAVTTADDRPLLLDANQGWNSVEEAVGAINSIDPQRIIGIEQPFPKDRWDMHKALADDTGALVIADESVQDMADLERAVGVFGGVNLKLMKCGGTDQAGRMARRAHELGLKVMLGSMSESTLGCATMLALAGLADLADLDGPWLLSNDPFMGLGLVDGRFVLTEGTFGTGVEPRPGFELDWMPVCA